MVYLKSFSQDLESIVSTETALVKLTNDLLAYTSRVMSVLFPFRPHPDIQWH